MQNTKLTLLSIAIIATLPFTALADDWVETWTDDGVTYHSVNAPLSADDNIIVSDNDAPFQTATIGEHDDEHIATTAYVKGAYNDTIAALNRMNEDVISRQAVLYVDGIEVQSNVLDKDGFISAYAIGIADDNSNNAKSYLASAQAVAKLVDVQRVRIYTTWGTDTAAATTLVPFEMAQ